MAREEAEIKELSDKLSKNPESLVFAPLADAHRRLKRYEEAIEICKKGLDVHPHYMTARVVLGRAYMESEMLDEAQEEFRTVVHADANHAMAHSMLGQIYSRKGMFPQAIQEHQLVLSINPDDTATQALLQEALEWARQPGRSQAPVATAPAPPPPPPVVKKAPEPPPPPPPPPSASSGQALVDSQATLKVAEIYIKKGNLDEALEVFQDLLASDPGNQVALAKLKEIKALKEARDKKPEKPQAASFSGMNSGSDHSDDKITTDDIFSALDFKPAKKEAPAPPPPPVAAAPPPPPPPAPAPAPVKAAPAPVPVASAPAPAPAAVAASSPPAGLGSLLTDFNQTNGIEGSLYLDRDGKVLEGRLSGVNDLAGLGAAASSIFLTTEKAVSRMRQGKLNQIMIAGEDGRQILFAPLKAGILAAVASKNANLGMLRIALHDLARKVS